MARKRKHQDITSPGKEFWNNRINPITGYVVTPNTVPNNEKTDVYLVSQFKS